MVADADDFYIGMFMTQAQKIAHVGMVEIDPGNFPGHWFVSYFNGGSSGRPCACPDSKG
jgi:hypothetical protein